MQPEGGLAGVGVTLGRFNDAGLGPYKALKPMVGGFAPFRLLGAVLVQKTTRDMRESHGW